MSDKPRANGFAAYNAQEPHPHSLVNNWDRVPKCSKTLRNGQQCRNPAMDNGKCRHHGGRAHSGIATSSFTTGRYTPLLKNVTLAEAYEAAKNDPELLNLSEEIMLIRARLMQLVGRLPDEDSQGRWLAAQDALKRFKESAARQDEYGWRTAMADLEQAVIDGGKDSLSWDEIMRTIKQYSDIISKEQRRRMEMNALVSVDEAVGFAAEVMYAVKEYVSDPTALQGIHNRIQDALLRKKRFVGARKRFEQDQDAGVVTVE